MAEASQGGATFAELLITLAVLAITAAVVVPSLSFNDANKLAVATEEAVNALRFARNEAVRTGQSVLLDTETTGGRLRLVRGGCGSVLTGEPVLDPLTKRAFVVEVSGHSTSSGVVPQARFLVDGVIGSSVVFAASGGLSQACSLVAGIPSAALPDNSLVLSYGGRRVTLAVDPVTGRVSGH